MLIYNDLLKKTPSTSAEGESGFTFTVSGGWFKTFTNCGGIHGVGRHGDAASSYMEEAEKYGGKFHDCLCIRLSPPAHVYLWRD